MQTMPALLWNKRGVLVSHRTSFIFHNSRSSVVAAFVSNAEREALAARAPLQRISPGGRLRLRQMFHAIFLAVTRNTKIQIRVGYLGRAADSAAEQSFGWVARLGFNTPAPC